MQYHLHDEAVNSTVDVPVPRRVIDAHSLPHLKLAKAVRAVDGADVVDGMARLENLTLRLVAAAMRVSVSYLVAACRLSPEQRQAIRQGRRPLVLPRAPVPPSSVPATPPAIPVAALDRLVDIVNELGGVTETLNVLSMLDCRIAA